MADGDVAGRENVDVAGSENEERNSGGGLSGDEEAVISRSVSIRPPRPAPRALGCVLSRTRVLRRAFSRYRFAALRSTLLIAER